MDGNFHTTVTNDSSDLDLYSDFMLTKIEVQIYDKDFILTKTSIPIFGRECILTKVAV